MVNVSKRTPHTLSASTTTETTTPATLSHPPVDDAPSSEHKRDSKPDIKAANASPKAKAIAIKPYASSQSVIDTRAKSSHASRASTSSSSSSSAKAPIVPSPLQQLEQQQQQVAHIPVQPRISPPQQQQVVQPHMHPQVIIQPSFPGPYDVVGYERVWSEANVAVLIQLHRKHYNGVTSMDVDQQNMAWAALTSEYNAITADNRSTPVLIKKWDKLMAKYNAERAFLIMPRPQGLQQPVPTVSYWNHFQYMDSYLSHVPIPENCIRKRKRRVEDTDESDSSDPAKRPRMTTDLNMELLETQRVFMEKTLDKQNTQIEMMKANAESMHKMNMKFVNICEKACTRSQINEERYLNLLEKCLVSNNKDRSKKSVTEVYDELQAVQQQAVQQQAQEASLRQESTYSSASSELAKSDEE
ncbi:hypothetical protein MAM1_0379d10184 [Mucor ambiguus]|uniref:Myb/SANT-like DNA-binding domain-containing protein n=1 Tax=Mucor ambiguus TaxID=91626 RepID=A0A0C9LY37_9FUNG|nr:hypothetical protein MAM1_0379d10184 [Mucor ambiguus]